MYAIIKTGGKQYRVSEGERLLVERLPDEEGATVDLRTLLLVDGETLLDGDGLSEATVQAKVLSHERGPKLRIVKFKPKRGYKNRNGHRQDLTRIEITALRRESASGSRPAPATATATATATASEESNGA